MDKDLISRQAAIDALDNVLVEDESCKVWFKLALQQLPSAERRGRWIHRPIEEWGASNCKCSACGTEYFFPLLLKGEADNYCGNCGARMMG